MTFFDWITPLCAMKDSKDHIETFVDEDDIAAATNIAGTSRNAMILSGQGCFRVPRKNAEKIRKS